jgi:hypothetical protein
MRLQAADVMDDMTDQDLGQRNRRVRLVLLAIVTVLAVATFLVGIRW